MLPPFRRQRTVWVARYAQDVQIRTTSGRANASSARALFYPLLPSQSSFHPLAFLSLSLFDPATTFRACRRSLTRCTDTRVLRPRACNVHARVRMRHAVDATNPMHFNIGSFNDLHNEAICFLSSRMRPRRLSRNRIRKYMYTC